MSDSNIQILNFEAGEGDSPLKRVYIRSDSRSVNLTGKALKAVVKATAETLDSTGTTYEIGTGITVVDAARGIINIQFTTAALGSAPGTKFWKLVALTSSYPETYAYGTITIINT